MEAKSQEHPLYRRTPDVADRIQEMKPYDPVSSREKIKQHPELSHFKLDWNESTIPPSPRVAEALIEYLGNGSRLNWYPDMFYRPLFERLSDYVGSSIPRLLVTNGSDAALELVCKTYLDPTDNVVYPEPTYNHFIQFAQLSGAELRPVVAENPYQPSIYEIENRIDEHTKIVYLVNPNNPTGNVFSPAEVLQLALRYPHLVVLCDEAYFEFSGLTCVKLVDEVPNLIVTRSFSKAFGLAGLRLGYLIAQEEVIQNLRRVHNPKSVNMLAQVAATAALDDLSFYRQYVREVKRSAALFQRFCQRNGIPCRLTYANWVLLQFEDAPDIVERLAELGVHVRDRSSQLPGVIRISLGTEAQTIEILSRLERVLAESRADRPVLLSIAAPDVR